MSAAPYSENQTSIKISTSSLQNSESFVRKAVITVIFTLCFHRCLIHVKSRRKNLLDASVVLIQALIRSPEHRDTIISLFDVVFPVSLTFIL